MVQQASILGASGAMGSLFARQLRAAGFSITGFDIRPPASRQDFNAFVIADCLALDESSRSALGKSQCVIICLPHDPALAAIETVTRLATAEALVIDTLSVKSPVLERLESLNPACEYLSINPMFAPSLGFQGQRVIAVPCRDGKRSTAFVKMIETWGAHVTTMTADEHDRACAIMQSATHAALIALAQLCASGFKIDDLLQIAPPPFLLCLSLAARIAAAAPETYWDIQRHNPHAADLRRELIAALAGLDAAVAADDYAKFVRILESVKGGFDEAQSKLSDTAAAAIAAVSSRDARSA